MSVDPGTTHYPTCYRTPGHHACAIHLVEQMQTSLRNEAKSLGQEAGKLIAEAIKRKDAAPLIVQKLQEASRNLRATASHGIAP